jgi:hypothetical protein
LREYQQGEGGDQHRRGGEQDPPDPLDPDPGGFDASASLFQRLSGPGEQEQGIVRPTPKSKTTIIGSICDGTLTPSSDVIQPRIRSVRNVASAMLVSGIRGATSERYVSATTRKMASMVATVTSLRFSVDGDFRIVLDQPDSRHRRPQRARAPRVSRVSLARSRSP